MLNNKKTAILISLALHAGLILLALFISFTILPPTVYRQIEIMEFGFSSPSNNQERIAPSPAAPTSGRSAFEGRSSSIIPDRVDLPKAISESDMPIYQPRHDKAAFNRVDLDDRVGVHTRAQSQLSESPIAHESIRMEDEPLVPSGEDYLSDLSDRLSASTSGDEMYTLEGEIIHRSVLNKVIPSYPEGLQRSASVKLRFDVLPDGSVRNIVIVQKADQVLEQTSIEAIRQWRFNPIQSDIVQSGFITFRYELK